MTVLEEEAGTTSTASVDDFVVLTINASWRCPVKCSYCHVTMKASLDDRTVIDEHSLRTQLESAFANGVTEIRFSGGEPVSLGRKLFAYADIVYATLGAKPNLLTSGAGINERWLRDAAGRFNGIYVSVENPFKPLQRFVNNKRILSVMRANSCDELPFRYGLTLVSADQFGNLHKIFDLLYDNMRRSAMPQLDYPCLKGFVMPDDNELIVLQAQTRDIFQANGLVPYYFVNLIGSPVYLFAGATRVVLNLHPDGRYDIYDTIAEARQYSYQMKRYAFEAQRQSQTCQKCQWVSSCRFHESGRLMYDWCDTRRAIWRGVYEGLNVTRSGDLSPGDDFVRFLQSDPETRARIEAVQAVSGMSTGSS
jgi:MoaA/NifB/PqqE/SkfB family radical SAM enzyme